VKSSTDSDEPRRAQPYSDSELPRRAKER
jgi:hypothetical protein